MRICPRCKITELRLSYVHCPSCLRERRDELDKIDPSRPAKRQARNNRYNNARWLTHGHTRKESHATWLKENADRQREHRKRSNAIRSARLAGAEGSFTVDDVENILTRQQFRCHWCCGDISDGLHSIDHYIPLARGGSNYASNIVLACGSCNSSKGNKMPEDFLAYLKKRSELTAGSQPASTQGDQL